MKRTILLLSAAVTALAFGACNKHSWEEGTEADIPVKKIFQPHGHGGHGDHDGDHGKHDGEGDKHHGDGEKPHGKKH